MLYISLIFFLSGLSALVYQLLWMRHLGFIFGNTVFASATVLTAFMGGLGLGAHIFGRFSERLKNPLRTFAWLELGVAGYALIVPFLFRGISLIYRFVAQNISESPTVLTPIRFILALIVLLIPTLLMGGTLPVLIRGLANKRENFGAKLSWLYGVNTLGAVAGIWLSGFYLIPAIGLTLTNLIAAATDALAGLGALVLSCLSSKIHQPAREKVRPKFTWEKMPSTSRHAILITFLCGFVSLALEVIWFRALILVFGSTTYSFTVMLGVFLLGISLGSLITSPLLDKLKNLNSILALFVILIGLYTLWSLYHFDNGPDLLMEHLVKTGFVWNGMIQARFIISALHLAIPAFLFGACFTFSSKIVRNDEPSSSGAVGIVYTLNTIGAVLGSFLGGFLLLPALGLERSLVLLTFLMCTGGLFSLFFWVHKKWIKFAMGLFLVSASALIVSNPPAWNKSMLASGAFFSPFNFVRNGEVILRQSIIGDRLLHYEEALGSTVSVHMNDNEEKYYCINGKTEADQSPRSMVLQRMIGHLPMLFHPDAKKAVNIGLGAGVSFGALAAHPVEHAEVVEIEPAVQRATQVWGALNHNIMDNPKVIFTFNDGRNHLFATTNRYDVITADPFEPVMAGAANLYTVEYFKLGRDRLKEDGIMGQFLPLYELSLDNYLSIVRSFVHVFPNTALFYTGFDTILIGFKGDIDIQMKTLSKNYEVPAVKESLEEIGFTSPEMILSMFVADLGKHPEFSQSGILNTDDSPYIEYSAPKSSLRYTTDENQSALLHIFTDIPEKWLEDMDAERAEVLRHEHQAVKLMLEGAVYRARGEITKAYAKLEEGHRLSPSNPVIINEMVAMLYSSANTLQQRGQIQAAAQQFQAALALDPNDFWSLFNMVIINMSRNQTQAAEALLQHALTLYPESPLMMGLNGKYLFSQGEQAKGLEWMKKATDLHPGNLGLWNDLNMMASLSGNIDLQKNAQQNIHRIQNYVRGK